MEKVKLFTDNGGYVTTVVIPHFNTAPAYITWGQRAFILRKDGKYYEAFGVAALTTVKE